jgi:hypothetical protein
MMTRDLLVGTPLSALAGGAVRMRRMTFLFNGEPFIVFVPSRPAEKSRLRKAPRNTKSCLA